MDYEILSKKLEDADQAHLLQFYETLDDEKKTALLRNLSTINFHEANKLFKNAMNSLTDQVEKLDDRMKPIPPELFESECKIDAAKLQDYKSLGLQEISRGHVAVVLMAGGQGSRLGVSYPKGMYSVDLISKKTLFQVQAERIRTLQKLAHKKTGEFGVITWYIMTSGPTVGPTRQYLEENKYFGLEKENVIIFQQGLLPSFDFDGKMYLEEKHAVSLAPDGNGGIYKALKNEKIIDNMEKRGVKYVHMHSVDNILVKVADPVFIGYCVTKNADCGAKVVSKASPTEAVGVVCLVDDKFQVVEYSEITEKTANLTDSSGQLVFNAGNICNHFFTRNFLSVIAEKYLDCLKLHVAKKKIPHVNKNGEKVKATSPNGIKIEKFVFDVFEFADKFVTWEVPRHVEFSALKNADDAGKDCPSTARRDLFNLHKQYVTEAGGQVIGDEIEISSLLSYAGENLKEKCQGKQFQAPAYISE